MCILVQSMQHEWRDHYDVHTCTKHAARVSHYDVQTRTKHAARMDHYDVRHVQSKVSQYWWLAKSKISY